MGIYSISNRYITKMVVLVSEPVRGRSRAIELPCFFCFVRIDSYTPFCLCLLHFIAFQADIYVKMYKAQ